MRPSQKQNRARGRGNRKPNGNIVNRVFESAGPEGKVRGTPQQIIDKYLTLARDAQTTGDRVMSENFLQHAEHYQRILLDAQGARQEQRRDQSYAEQEGADGDGRDDSSADEGERAQAGGQRETRRDDRDGRDDQARDDQAREDRAGHASADDQSDEGEVSGLTTIDSGSEEGGSLLVEAEDLSASQPPRRRRNQRRSKSQDSSESQPAESRSD